MLNVGEAGMKVTRRVARSMASSIKTVVGIGVLMQAAWIQAATIEDISFAALPGDQFEIKLEFGGQAVEPKGYAVDSPARIVLDFEGTDSALAEKKYPLAFDNAQSTVVLSAEGRTRMIVNLKTSVPYEVTMGANSLTLLVGNSSASTSVGSVGKANSQGVAKSVPAVNGTTGTVEIAQNRNSIEDVDFSRGEKGEGTVSIALANANTPIDISREGSAVVVSFYHTALPEAFDRKLDVIDFATPIKSVDTRSDGTMTKVTIESLGEYDYLGYQADNLYVVSVKPLTKEELADQQSKFEFTGEKLSLNFQDIEVRSVLQLIADFTELNLVASDTVRGSITLRLENVPWDQALDIILKAKGLDKRQQGNVLMVAPAVEIAEQERLQVEANKQLVELAPLVTDYVRIRYADARELYDLFDVNQSGGGETATSSLLSTRGSAIVDERTNTIILTDVQQKIDDFRRLIKEIDIPIRQVEIDARIVVATTDFRKEIGMRWGIAGVRNVGGGDTQASFVGNRTGQRGEGVWDAFGGQGDQGEGNSNLNLIDTLATDLGASTRFGSLSLGLLKDNTMIDWEISAMESDGFGEIISQPKVMTGDKQEAIIKSGVEIPYQTGTSSGETQIEFRDAVLQLKVTPQITPDNRIIMDLVINQDRIGQIVPTAQGGAEPTIDTTEVRTQALVGDGQTLVLGGIFQMEEQKVIEKVPLLGDIPYLGRLFRNTLTDTSKKEILIFVTPRIVSDPLLDQ